MDRSDMLDRLNKLEGDFLTGLQELRAIRAEIEKKLKQSPTLEPLLDAEELAKILGVEVPYIYAQARKKQIPCIEIGKYRKFSPSAIKKWLDHRNTP